MARPKGRLDFFWSCYQKKADDSSCSFRPSVRERNSGLDHSAADPRTTRYLQRPGFMDEATHRLLRPPPPADLTMPAPGHLRSAQSDWNPCAGGTDKSPGVFTRAHAGSTTVRQPGQRV